MTGDGWARSSKCSSGTCVEVRWTDRTVAVRDSKELSVTSTPQTIEVDPQAWTSFLDQVSNGVFVDGAGQIAIATNSAGVELVHDGVALTFDHAEYEAFRQGVLAGEFRSPGSR